MSFNVFNMSEAADNLFNFCIRLLKISVLYLFPVVSAGFFVCFSWRGIQFPHKSTALTANFSVSSRQTCPLFYPIRQLNHVCRVDAEEDVQDFRPLRPGLDPLEIVVFFLCPERAFHRSRPHSGKFLSDKVFLLFLLTERTASFYERCLYSVRLAVVPVFGSRVASVSSDLFRFDPKQSLVHLQEHQGHFPFRSEERPASRLRPHAFPYQTEVICHLAEREQLLYPAQFALFES